MSVNLESIRRSLRDFDFKKLFIEELNWDRLQVRPPVITVDGSVFTLTPIAEKRGFQIFQCSPDKNGKIPDDKLGRRVDRELTKLVAEHLIIFIDREQTAQTWQWAKREHNKLIALRRETYHKGQTGQRLAEKVKQLFIALEEEENLFITDVSSRARRGFDVDRVTKRFYDRFKKEHAAFLGFIKGIQEKGDREWYASLMLNRLMFIYFIQKKEFLDGDVDYLRNRLKKLQSQKGRNRFHSFYRYFLLRLFHEGLGSQKRDKELDALLGKVPYLNGGLFDIHELERENQEIEIEDRAFEQIFDFFEEYDWHLDDRPLRSDHEINPDVLGYIFEKYINQKQMGAYYTKEDITEYISKNTVIPFLFDAARKRCPIAFEPDSALWRLLKENPDRYIYDAVRRGVIDEQGNIVALPVEIEAGINDVSKRGGWNKAADDEFALPTETWREYVHRRKRCLEIRERLKAGQIHSINDLITYNLDIRQFAQDAIDNCEGVDLLRAFYRVIAGHIPQHSNEKFEMGMSILDPTCGSGAFLFAALNILEPLYEACLSRMQSFIDESSNDKLYPDFRRILERVEKHPNRRYFILKSIIIGNLYGVDIMEEAAEICKLRLFLKLVAHVDKADSKPNFGIEALPDIDFNIRAGNTLVGFATFDEAKRSVDQTQTGQVKMQFDGTMARIDEDAMIIARKFKMFREMQMVHNMDAEEFHEAKESLRISLRDLENELNRYLAGEYGVNPDKVKAFQAWRESLHPFHWFVEFYSIMKDGGFDVIIGNPPYVELSDVKGQYVVKGLTLVDTGNLYSLCVERFEQLLVKTGRCGVIMPISSVSTPRMLPLMKVLISAFSPLHLSHFAVRPGKLFVGVDMNLTIMVGEKRVDKTTDNHWSTKYNRWGEAYRHFLFNTLAYAPTSLCVVLSAIPKIGSTEEASLMKKLSLFPHLLHYRSVAQDAEVVYYHSGGRYFRKCLREQLSNEYKELRVKPSMADAVISLLSSSLYYWFWIAVSDCYHVTRRDIDGLPAPESLAGDSRLTTLAEMLIHDLYENAETRVRNRADGSQRKEVNFQVGKSKRIIDDIDCALAIHYELTPDELNALINYDIKYRGDGSDE